MSKRLRFLLAILVALIEEFVLAAYLVRYVGLPWAEQIKGAWSWFYTTCSLVNFPCHPGGICPAVMVTRCTISPLKIIAIILVFILFSVVNWFIIKMITKKLK